MPAPLVQSGQKLLNGFILRPEITQQDSGIVHRPLALLRDQFVHGWMGIEVVPRIVEFVRSWPPHF